MYDILLFLRVANGVTYTLIIDEIIVWIIKKINAYDKTKTFVLKCEWRVFSACGDEYIYKNKRINVKCNFKLFSIKTRYKYTQYCYWRFNILIYDDAYYYRNK